MKLRERRTPGNQISYIKNSSGTFTECDSRFSELFERFLKWIGRDGLRVPAWADGDAEHVQGEEEDGPHHAKPAGQEWGRECDINDVFRWWVGGVGVIIGGFQELCGAHPGDAHHAEN